MTLPACPGTSPLVCVLDARASLGGCSVWPRAEHALYWVDINAPSLNRFDIATGTNVSMPMPESIGSFALRATGGFVVALRDGILLAGEDGALARKLADARYDPAHHRFNDGHCDAQCPTMRAFGGEDLQTLYVTTARQNRDAGELARLPQSGGIFAIRVDVPGLPEPAFAG